MTDVFLFSVPEFANPNDVKLRDPTTIGGKVDYVISLAVGAYAYSGKAATFNYARSISLAVGSYTYTGISATLLVAHSLALAKGSYTYTGIAANLSLARNLALAKGEYTYAGIAANLTVARNLALGKGIYPYTGLPATLTYVPGSGKVDYVLSLSAGAYSYLGNDATLVYFTPKTGHVGGDDAPKGWRKEKKRKVKDDYLENVVERRQAVIRAYEGLLESQTPLVIANKAKTVVESEALAELDLIKVQKLLALWQDELNRRREQDDEESILMLL